MTIIAIRLLDRVGRRTLLLVGTVGMAVGMFVVAFSFTGGENLRGRPRSRPSSACSSTLARSRLAWDQCSGC